MTTSIAVLYCNLGTPQAPTPKAVRRFLGEFLSDRRVVEIPRLIWLPLLYGVVLRVRPAKTAGKYQSIWRTEGSPLRYWTERQAQLLASLLTRLGCEVTVRVGMRYGAGSIAEQLGELHKSGARKILILPAYPQYSGTTSASLFDAVYAWAGKQRDIPEFRFVNSFASDPSYIQALAQSVREHWARSGRAQLLLMSFHGIPKRNIELGDPYEAESRETARLLAEALEIQPAMYKLTFQSRLGRAEWLQPYTEPTLVELAKNGLRSVDVICPGFNCDGLETLEEIDQEARQAFLTAGGHDFRYIPCLNGSPEWIQSLAQIAQRHLEGWLDEPTAMVRNLPTTPLGK